LVGEAGAEKVLTIDLATAIAGFARGFVGQTVGSKLRLHIHPDWGYSGCFSRFGDSLLIVDAEILSTPF
jgi:FKBP-type peptidyl-prolyl cis-trans isomerase